jgi:hypothetical protein
MKSSARAYGLPILASVTLLAGGCNSTAVQGSIRGEFVKTCDLSLEAVPAGAMFALYLDKDGNILGDYKDSLGNFEAHRAEQLAVTNNNQMCPTPPPSGPGSCPAGYCMKLVPGTTKKMCQPC